MIDKVLLAEKFRPKVLEDLMLPDRILEKFKNGIYQNFLLEGPAGTGKTSTAKVLATLYADDYLYKNASSDRGIDVIRDEITNYCSNLSLLDGERRLKIVVLDEVDGANETFYNALRATMDKFANNARFILTCNYVNKIPEPIISRCEVIKYDFTDDEETQLFKKYCKKLNEIIKSEGMIIQPPVLVALVKRLFPDMRKLINYVQAIKNEGKTEITIDDIQKFHGLYKDLYELVFSPKPNPQVNYKYLIENYSNRVDDVLNSFSEDFIDYVTSEKPSSMKHIPAIIIEVAEYQAQRERVIDPTISMVALFYKLQIIING